LGEEGRRIQYYRHSDWLSEVCDFRLYMFFRVLDPEEHNGCEVANFA
jgi:hypothetical protein